MPARAQISVRRPSVGRIRHFVGAQREMPLSYEPVGATGELDAGSDGATYYDYSVDAVRAELGTGATTYERAVRALRRWAMFDVGWVELCWPDTGICRGAAVAVLARVARGWLLNASRIAYVVTDTGTVERSGFAYGTLPGHVLRGEEKFVVEWNRDSDRVSFELVALSRPNHAISWLSYPLVRGLQRRFRRDAVRAMRNAVRPV